MEQGHVGEYSGNNGKLIHKHYMENSIHDFETGHPVAGKYEAERASAFKQRMDDEFLSPVDGSDQNLDNSAERAFENNYGMSAARMSALKNRYSEAIPQNYRSAYDIATERAGEKREQVLSDPQWKDGVNPSTGENIFTDPKHKESGKEWHPQIISRHKPGSSHMDVNWNRTFNEAYRGAYDAIGEGGTFSWRGGQYSTNMAKPEDKKK